MAHGQAAYPSHIQGPTIPGSFQRPDVPQESAIPPADQGLTRDGQLQAIPAHPRGSDGQTLPQPGVVSSPFDEHQVGYQTPNVRPTERAQGIDISPTPAQVPGRFNSYDQNLPYDSVLGKPASWEISYKENKDLSKFDATITNYEEWATNIKDHLSRTNRGWPTLLNFVEKQPHHHNYQMLSQMHVGGVNGWDIACTLETFLVAWLGKAARARRLQMSGNQAGNGLEMWRQLYREYKGTGELIDASGRKLLNNFPQCKSMEHLSEHLDKWTKLVTDYGQEIAMHASKQLRVMLMEILPTGLEEELEHPLSTHIKTCEQIVEWCKANTLKSRQKLLASQKLKNLNLPGGRMAPLTSGDSWGQPPNSALNSSTVMGRAIDRSTGKAR